MKLIDVLVQELPQRGGWPTGVGRISMHDDGRIYFDGMPAPRSFRISQCDDGWQGNMSPRYCNGVTREQYEKRVWDGTGLPPVGTECEALFNNDDSPKWYNFQVLFQTEQHVIATVGGEEISYKTSELNSNDVKFRPIRTERDKAVEQILTIIDCHGVDPLNSAAAIYDAIVAGKIDGLGKVG